MIHQIQEEKCRNEGNVTAIIKAHEKLQQEEKISPYSKVVKRFNKWRWFYVNNFFLQSKLKGMYSTAVADAEKEEEIIRKVLSKIYEIRVIRHERRIQVSFEKSQQLFPMKL